MNLMIEQEKFNALIEELEAIFVEHEFSSRWYIIKGYHEVGKRLREERGSITDLVKKCAVAMNVSDRKLWYAVKFYDKFPKLDKVPEGKNISWSTIKDRYLTESIKDFPTVKPKRFSTCPQCGYHYEI